jgi:hypothetical protein
MKKLLMLVGMCTAFILGYGVLGEAFPGAGMYGRGEYRGYFTNSHDTAGTYVLPKQYSGQAFPSSINSATEFINFLKGSEGLGGSSQQRTGAAFIIQTMIGSARNRPPTAAQIAEWEGRVRYAESQGRVSWRTNYSFCINSYYQGPSGGGSPNDDAFYDDCGTQPSMLFRNASGAVVYAIKWECANPVGNVRPVDDDPPPVDFTMSGRTTVNNATPLPGQTIQFSYYVRNAGPTGTSPTSIWWVALNSLTSAVVGGTASSGTYTSGQEKNVFTENYTVPAGTAAGTQICRQTGYDPVNDNGARNGRGTPVCATVRYDFSLTPIINFTVNGTAAPGSIAEQGDTITFNYSVNNSGLTQSMLANCTIYGLTRTGSYSVPTPHDSASDPGYVPPPTGCPRTFPLNTTTPLGAGEDVIATDANRTICRSLWVNPATAAGEARSAETCIRIVAKPYLKVYGGDVSAGGGLETMPDTCSNNANAAIVSWNKRTAGDYAGAGTQYAAFALRPITDFATGRGQGAAIANPSWLSFANNTTNPGSGNFGGTFGSAPCIKDYYDRRPATTTPIPAGGVSPMQDGVVYGTPEPSGPVTLSGGIINPGEKITVYIDGNLFIDNNITYTPNWNHNNIPLFQVVVRGNIYISNNVTQLDGVYIAQRDENSGGTIYTCATGTSQPTLTDGAFYNACNNRLEVNGAFMANSVEFLRTAGTLSQSNAGETSPGTAGEVFNFNPSVWMVQPPQGNGQSDNYDAITSLPPVL